MMVPKKLVFLTAFLFFGMAFLLVKENEGRTSAETKLNTIQYKADFLKIEKENVIADLQTQVNHLEAALKEAGEKYDAFAAEKTAEIEKMNVSAEEARLAHEEALKVKDDEMTQAGVQAKKVSDGLNERLKEKNAEISGLASQLKEVSSKLDEILKKRDALESQNTAYEDQIADLKNETDRLQRHNKKLLETLRNKEKQNVIMD